MYLVVSFHRILLVLRLPVPTIWFPKAALTKYLTLDGLEKQIYCLRSGGQKSEITVWAGPCAL